MPSSDDINSAFGDQWGLLFTVLYGLGLVLYGLGLPYDFRSCYYTDWDCFLVSFLVTIRIGTAFSFPFLNAIRIWDCLPYRVLYWFWTGSVSSRECPATVFKKLRSRREALSFTKSIPVLFQN